jgi:predicted TIM-barrel fold metal-dependent hydrolase
MPGICDCHMHVFGPPERYPGAPDRTYDPTEKGLDHYGPVAGGLGIDRFVVVQPSAYGTDNRCTLDVLRAHPATTRGVVVIDDAVADDTLAEMDELGVRGVRLNLKTPAVTDPEEAGIRIQQAAERIAFLGWHLQTYVDVSLIPSLAPAVRSSPVPVVFDHMGGARADVRPADSRFRSLLELLSAGHCWVKLSGADRVTGDDLDFAAAAPFARALIEANPRRLVWGTDWPHLADGPGPTGAAAPPAVHRAVSERRLLRAFESWAVAPITRRRILTGNPAELYRF